MAMIISRDGNQWPRELGGKCVCVCVWVCVCGGGGVTLPRVGYPVALIGYRYSGRTAMCCSSGSLHIAWHISEGVYIYLLPAGSEQRGVLGIGGIPVPILPSCQDKKTIAL